MCIQSQEQNGNEIKDVKCQKKYYQKTNKGVYKADSYQNISITNFLTEQLHVINKHFSTLEKYINILHFGYIYE